MPNEHRRVKATAKCREVAQEHGTALRSRSSEYDIVTDSFPALTSMVLAATPPRSTFLFLTLALDGCPPLWKSVAVNRLNGHPYKQQQCGQHK